MGLDVLVEKPMAVNLAEADALLHAAKKNGRILQVGHVERFNPAVIAVEPILNRPLFFEVHRLGVFTRRSLDVDVIYDLMIHDLDILLALVSEPVTELEAFVDAARSRKEPRTNGAAGRAALELAGRVMASIQEHAARVNVLGGGKTADVERVRQAAGSDAFLSHDKTR